MGMKVMIAVLLVVVVAGCSVETTDRAEKPADKGMELYSWKPDGDDWHFSLVEGTNRVKTTEEITQHAVASIAELKKQLSKQAKGENVFWRNLAKEPVPKDMEKDLRAFCEKLEVKLELI